MNKTRLVQYLTIFTTLILSALLLSTGMVIEAAALRTDIVNQVQGEEKMLHFSSEGHVLGFGINEVYLAGIDHALKVEFLGASCAPPFAEIEGTAENGSPALGIVTYRSIWKDIDVIFSSASDGIAESTYIIHPGGDPDDISLRYNVAVEIMPDGGLRLDFENGYMTESAPIAWQEINGSIVPIPVQLQKQALNQVGFSLGSYDADHAVYIDPVYQWHTFFGGAGQMHRGLAIALDSSGNVYVTGRSASSWNGPLGAAPLNVHSGSGSDIVVIKLNSAGAYQWHTFFGTERDDIGYGIAVDGWGNVYVTGDSYKPWNGPGGVLPLNAHGGGDGDIVVIKLNSAGAYQWHTFYGGRDYDRGEGIALDSSGNVYVAGRSDAGWSGPGGVFGDPLNFHAGGSYMPDIVIIKLNSAGQYQWHTFYGSSNIDEGSSIAVDAANDVYVTGFSNANWYGPSSVSGPNTAAPINPHSGGRDRDIVVVKLNSAGTFQWHTFHGGAGSDYGSAIAVERSGTVYVAGSSNASWNGPVGEAPRNAYSGDKEKIVVVKLNSAGTFQWHTFYGGTGNDYGNAITVEPSGNVYVSGSSSSWNGPGGIAPRNNHTGGGLRDLVVVKVNNTGAYQWHTFYGGTYQDSGNGIAVDSSGNFYVTGHSDAAWNGPGGRAPINPYGVNSDIVVIKHGGSSEDTPPIPTLVSPANGATVAGTGADSRITFRWNASTGADRYQFRLRSVGAAQWQYSTDDLSDTNGVASGFPNDGRQYEWSVRAGNSAGQWSDWSSPWTFTNGSSQQGTFPDVPPTHAHYAGIEAIAARNITRGYTDGTFRPSQPVTRAEMATFLARALNLPPGGQGTFPDVPPTHTHYANIEAIAARGITRGYTDGTFRPSQNVTRAEMATFLTRAFNLPPGGPPPFSDVTTSNTHYPGIAAIAAANITRGYPDGTFRPSQPVTRGEMATFLARALGLIN